MLYQDKYFPQDKNTILRAAQGFIEPQLLHLWVKKALEVYKQLENPLGLVDDFILELEKITEFDTSLLSEIYEIMSAIYRFKRGNNQLEFIWDGRSHYEVYAENWKRDFEESIASITESPEVYRPIMKSCILKQPTNHRMLFYAIRRIVLQQAQVQVGRNKMLKTA